MREKHPMAISQHYRGDQIAVDNFETRVAIYEDQVRGWFLDQARILEKVSSGAGFVILMVCLSYVEAYAIFYNGQDSKSKSERFFCDGIKAIFPVSGGNAELQDKGYQELWVQMRNGLFHTGMTREKVVPSGDFKAPIAVTMHIETQSPVRIEVNPHLMLGAIEDHLSRYTMRLRNPDEVELRENFNKAWNLRFDTSL